MSGSDSTAARSTEAPGSSAPTATATVEDSILDTMLPGRQTVTPAGDTLQDLGGGMLSEQYGLSEYKKNGDSYFRLQQSTGHKPDGKAIWRFLTRIRVAKLDSTEQLMFAGLCGTQSGPDNNVIAIARFNLEDTVFTAIRRAWKFDPSTETVKEMSVAGIKCWNPGH